MKNVVQDLTSAGIDWQREKWQSGLGSKFIHLGEKNAVKYADEVIVLSKGVQDYFKETYKDDAALPQAFSNKSFQELFAETYDHRISQAEWVRDMDYKKQGDAAQIVCEKLNTLR